MGARTTPGLGRKTGGLLHITTYSHAQWRQQGALFCKYSSKAGKKGSSREEEEEEGVEEEDCVFVVFYGVNFSHIFDMI